MKLKVFKGISLFMIFACLVTLVFTFNAPKTVHAQQPTGSIPTITGSPTGPMATVKVGLEDTPKVRSGPSTLDDQIGVILPGVPVSVKGRTIAGDWLLINYPGASNGEGWVWSLYMDVSAGELPVVEAPPTPAPKTTATIDPTMAAQFVITPQSTPLPTFTQPAPLVIPTYTTGLSSSGNIPVGLVIIILAGLGAVLGLFSIFQSR